MPFIQRGPTHDIPYLDIRLDDDVAVLRGSPGESSGALLNGRVALCVREAVSIKGIVLVLQGLKRLHWSEHAHPPVAGLISTTSRTVRHDEVFYEKKWNLVGDGTTALTLSPGNYEHPFQQALDGDIPESVEGLPNAHIVYRLKARVLRGKFSHDITVKKHLRIIRTLASESLELAQTMAVENLWPNKVEYSISIPRKAVVFGTYIPIDITLVPLLKGLTIGNVICALKEVHTLSCRQKASVKQDTRHIFTQTFSTGRFEESTNGDLGRWQLSDRIPLPKTLNACVQDCEVPSIKIRHKLKFTIELHNPDGHVSELRASLPVVLFISPNYLMDDSNRIPGDVDVSTDVLDGLASAPPRYDEHYLDRLYDGVPPTSFDTPLPSGANTPATLSSTNSVENLALVIEPLRLPDAGSRSWGNSPHGNSSSSTTQSSTPATAAADTDESHAGAGGDYFSSCSASAPTPAPAPAMPTLPARLLQDLSRVPSYTTAVRSGTRNLTDVPLYEEGAAAALTVRSAPASPQNSPLPEGFVSRPRLVMFGRYSQPATDEAGSGAGVGRRSLSSHHLPSLGGLLDGLRN